MINILDILSKYKENLDDKLITVNSMIETIMDNGSSLQYIFDSVPGVPINVSDAAIEEGVEPEEYIKVVGKAIYDSFNNITITDNVGQVCNIIVTTTSDYSTGTIYDASGSQKGMWGLNVDKYIFAFSGLSDEITNLADVRDNIISSSGVNNIISIAIDLAQQGKLTVENFMSSIPDIVNKANDQVMYIINAIRESIAVANPLTQAISLVNVLRKVFGNIGNATADDVNGKIDFVSTDFTISASFFLPMNVIVSLASNILTTVITMIKPVIGIAVGVVSNLIATIIDAAKSNDGTHWKLSNNYDRDNDCIAIPMIQCENIPYDTLQTGIKDALINHGFVKLTNGFMTLYIWVDDESRHLVKVEGFASGLSDLSYVQPGVTDFLFNKILSFMSFDYTVDHNISSTNTTALTLSSFKTNVEYWLDNATTPGGDAPGLLNSSFSVNELDRMCSRRLQYSFMLWAYMYFSCIGLEALHDFNTNINSALSGKRNINVTNEQIIAAVFGDIVYLAHDDADYFNVWNTDSSINGTNTIVVNKGIPALRQLFSELQPSYIIDLLNTFSVRDSQYTDAILDIGCGSEFVPSYVIINKGNAYLIPPTSSVSIWIQAAFTGAVISAIAVAAVITKAKIKRRIQYKASLARDQINNAYNVYANEDGTGTGQYSDWLKAYKLNKRYNRTWGKLSGATYDMNNGWIDYASDLSIPLSSTQGLFNQSLSKTNDVPVINSFDEKVYKSIVGDDSSNNNE